MTDQSTGQVRIIMTNNQVVDAVQLGTFTHPAGVTVTQNGRVVVADSGGNVGEIRFGAPAIMSLDPQRASGVGGETITIRGENFAPDTILVVGGVLVSTRTVVNTQTITFRAPALPSGR